MLIESVSSGSRRQPWGTARTEQADRPIAFSWGVAPHAISLNDTKRFVLECAVITGASSLRNCGAMPHAILSQGESPMLNYRLSMCVVVAFWVGIGLSACYIKSRRFPDGCRRLSEAWREPITMSRWAISLSNLHCVHVDVGVYQAFEWRACNCTGNKSPMLVNDCVPIKSERRITGSRANSPGRSLMPGHPGVASFSEHCIGDADGLSAPVAATGVGALDEHRRRLLDAFRLPVGFLQGGLAMT